MKKNTPLTITLCGSIGRARQDLERVHRALALAGCLVHAPVPALIGEPPTTAHQRNQLTIRHYAAIDVSDLVVVVARAGYMGLHTREEKEYAKKKRKIVVTLIHVDIEIDKLLRFIELLNRE